VPAVSSRPVVLSDGEREAVHAMFGGSAVELHAYVGTYATQSAVAEKAPATDKASLVPKAVTLRSLLLGGDYYLGTALSSCLTKLLMRLRQVMPDSHHEVAKGLLLMTSILRLGSAGNAKVAIDRDSAQRITMCIRVLLAGDKDAEESFLSKTRQVRPRSPLETVCDGGLTDCGG
jgi:hypothetical protein